MKTKTINLLLILTTIFSIPAYANCPKTDTIVVESSGIFSGTDELGNKWKSPDPVHEIYGTPQEIKPKLVFLFVAALRHVTKTDSGVIVASNVGCHYAIPLKYQFFEEEIEELKSVIELIPANRTRTIGINYTLKNNKESLSGLWGSIGVPPNYYSCPDNVAMEKPHSTDSCPFKLDR